MPHHDPGDIGPADPGLLDDGGEARDHLFAVGLVVDVRDVGDALGMVADETAEDDDRTAVGSSRPDGGLFEVERVVGERDPGLVVGRKKAHPVIVVGGAVMGTWRPTSVRWMHPPDENDDQEHFAPHPHPDDRLWRHPSETGPARRHDAPATVPARRARRSVVVPFAIAAMIIGSGVTFAALAVLGAFDPPPAQVVLETVSTPLDEHASATTIVDRLRPSLVHIEIQRADSVDQATGVVYRSDGYVLTTADAVIGATSITVITRTGDRVPARVVGVDPVDDVAVLGIDTPDVHPAVLVRTGTLDPGEQVIAISTDGDPTAPTAIPENVTTDGERLDLAGGGTMHDMIATAPSVEQQFSDAVLVDTRGGVLGVFTTRQPRTASVSTTNTTERYATPIDFAVRLADDLVATGRVHQAWLGVRGEDLDTESTARLGRAGAVLTEIADHSPAATAGLQNGDVVITVDASPIDSSSDLVITLRHHQVGDSIAITFIRDGAKRVTTATLENRP